MHEGSSNIVSKKERERESVWFLISSQEYGIVERAGEGLSGMAEMDIEYECPVDRERAQSELNSQRCCCLSIYSSTVVASTMY